MSEPIGVLAAQRAGVTLTFTRHMKAGWFVVGYMRQVNSAKTPGVYSHELPITEQQWVEMFDREASLAAFSEGSNDE